MHAREFQNGGEGDGTDGGGMKTTLRRQERLRRPKRNDGVGGGSTSGSDGRRDGSGITGEKKRRGSEELDTAGCGVGKTKEVEAADSGTGLSGGGCSEGGGVPNPKAQQRSEGPGVGGIRVGGRHGGG